MARNDDIVFRRIRGRIVPIRRNRSTKRDRPGKNIGQTVTGATLASAGIGTAIAGGIASRKLSKRSRKLATAQFRAKGLAELARIQPGRKGQLDLFSKEAGRKRSEKLVGRSRKFRTGSRRLRKFSFRTKALSIAVGGALLGTGLEQALSKPIKRSEVPSEVAKDFVLNLGSGLAAAAFVLGRGRVKKSTLKRLFKRGR